MVKISYIAGKEVNTMEQYHKSERRSRSLGPFAFDFGGIGILIARDTQREDEYDGEWNDGQFIKCLGKFLDFSDD